MDERFREAQGIVLRRHGRALGAKVAWAAATGAVVAVGLGAAGLPLGLSLVPWAFAAAGILGPFFGWRRGPAQQGSTEVGLSARLVLRTEADRLERASVVGPLTALATLAPLTFGALLGLALGVRASALGQALLMVAPVVAPALGLMGLLARREAKLLLAPPQQGWWRIPSALRPVIAGALAMAAGFGLTSIWPDPVASLVAGLYVLGVGSTFLVPSLWWLGRQIQREQRALAQVALPARFQEGPEVRPWLVDLLRSTEAPLAVRREALLELFRRFPAAELVDAVHEGLRSEEPALVTATLTACVEHRHRPDLEVLLPLAAQPFAPPADLRSRFIRRIEEEALVQLCHLLRRYRDPRVEPALIALLGYPSVPILAAAAETLGLIGTLEAVEPLRRAASAGARFVAEEAIERIQIRRGGRGGALSLVDGDPRGEVSVVEVEGAVSLPKG